MSLCDFCSLFLGLRAPLPRLNIAGLAGLNVPVKPVYICFRLTGNDEWCIDWVKIYNADLPSEYQVGDQIKGWDERFKSTSVWCKYLTYT